MIELCDAETTLPASSTNLCLAGPGSQLLWVRVPLSLPRSLGTSHRNPRGGGFLDLCIPEGGTAEISTLKDASNSTPLPQPLAAHAHRTIYTDVHTNTPMHTQAHTCAHVHAGVHTPPRKIEKRKASRPFANLLHNVCFPILSHQSPLAPANRGICGWGKAVSLHLNFSVQVHLLGGNLQAHR